MGNGWYGEHRGTQTDGRWPANLILVGDITIAEMDTQSGLCGNGWKPGTNYGEQYADQNRQYEGGSFGGGGYKGSTTYADFGTAGASRYFLCILTPDR